MANLYNVPLKNAVQKQLAATLLTAETGTATLDSSVVAELQASSNMPGIFVVDRIDSNGTETPNKREYVSFTGVSGSTVTGLVRGLGGSSAQDHAVGAIVEFVPDVVWAEALNDVIQEEHNYQGKHTAITASSASINNLTAINSFKMGDHLMNASTASLALIYTNRIIASSASIAIMNVPVHLNASGASLSGGFVTLDATQTLTNKTLTAPIISTATLTSPTISSPTITGFDGWQSANETWTYASATTFTIAGVDVTAKYRKGTRLKMTQTTAKYFVVASSSFSTNTTVTVLVSDEYTIANAAISANFYSYEDCPQGFPTKFTFTPTWTGFTGGSPANKILYQVHSGVIYCQFDTIATATSNSATLDFTIPVAAVDTAGYKHFWAHVIDNGSHQTNPGIIGVANSTTAKVGKTQPTASGNAFAGFTTSGTKGVSGEFYYSF